MNSPFAVTLPLRGLGMGLLILIFAVSCSVDYEPYDVSDINNLAINPDFDFKTLSPVLIEIGVKDQDDNPLSGVKVSVFKDPFNDQGLAGEAMFSGRTAADGYFAMTAQIPSYITHLYVQADAFGFPNRAEVSIQAGYAYHLFGGFVPDELPDPTGDEEMLDIKHFASVAGADVDYSFMGRGEGDWNALGVPNYREQGRVRFGNDFLEEVNEALPERRRVRNDYIADEVQTVIRQDATVRVVFVHEGAGYLNALGYYTYDPDSPPESVDDIQAHTIIFPNASYQGDGGGMRSGFSVNLGSVEGGTAIGWFLVANGWLPNQRTVGEGYGLFYSNSNLNPEGEADLRRHIVFLRNDERELLLLAFEDIQRDAEGEHPYNPDDDFNDVIFAVSVDPWDALNEDIIDLPDPNQDRDDDGVEDGLDDYPDDPHLAFNNYYPSEQTFGSIAFEDKWPTKGDYDFNDLVMAYRINQISNADEEVARIVAELDIKAVGAGFRNGFGFELPIPPGQVESVSGQRITDNYIRLAQSGVELQQRKAVIIVLDNTYNLVQPQGDFEYVNTERGASEQDVDLITITVNLRNPQNWNVWVDRVPYASPPYNPFLISNRERGREVHLPNYPPTSLANREYFGTGHDDSNFGWQRYYKTAENLPWGLVLPGPWGHVVEKEQITLGYPRFVDWAQSGGEEYPDWYLDRNGNINSDYIWRAGR